MPTAVLRPIGKSHYLCKRHLTYKSLSEKKNTANTPQKENEETKQGNSGNKVEKMTLLLLNLAGAIPPAAMCPGICPATAAAVTAAAV